MSAAIGEFLDSSPESRAAYDNLRLLLQSMENDFADLSKVPSIPALLDKLEPVGAMIEKIGAEATISAVTKAAAIRQTLTEKQTIQDYLMMTSLIAAGILLALSAFQNHTLRRAHREVKQTADNFAYLARHDPLTGLPNRTAFSDADQTIATGGRQMAVLVIDLDGFKLINDTWGHVFGDKLLIAAAHRLEKVIVTRPGNLVARLGGDEFAALLSLDTAEEAEAIADRVLEALKRPFEIDGSTVTIGATAGLALAGPGGWNALGLMADADLAQSDAKAKSKGTIRSYNPTLREGVERRLTLENDLRGAIAREEITPHYQIQVDLEMGPWSASKHWRAGIIRNWGWSRRPNSFPSPKPRDRSSVSASTCSIAPAGTRCGFPPMSRSR